MVTPDPTPSTHGFIESHLKSVWRYLRMHGANPDEADDLTQETVATALRKGALKLEPKAARAFLREAARYAWLHHLRRARREPVLVEAVDDLWDRDAQHDGGEELLVNLRNCIDKLDERALQAIQLSYGIQDEGVGPDHSLDRDQVAQVMGLRPNGLKTLLQRTRQALRECLERARR